MLRSRVRSPTTGLNLLLALLLAGCSSAPYRHQPFESLDVQRRAVTQEKGSFRVSASVPGRDEAEAIFGIPIYDRGIQPVWLQVTNNGDGRARLVLASIDPQYFPPLEVAYMHKKHFSKQGWMDLEKYLYANALPRHIAPHQTVSGFVFTHASAGTKAFNVDIFYTTGTADFEQFTFFVEVPGFVPDHSEVDFKSLYVADDVRHTDIEGLRTLLADIPCCTTNRDGSVQGRPIQAFFVATGRDLLRALLRAGWAETSYARDEDYLAAADYLFGRPADAIFRRGRDNSTERSELGLWLAPVTVDGEPLWIGQLRHAVGRRYALGEWFLGLKLDPDTCDARNYLLQNLWYTQSLEHWAWSQTGKQVPQETPEFDFHGNPWFANDAYRIVIWVSGNPIALSDASVVEWGRLEPAMEEQP